MKSFLLFVAVLFCAFSRLSAEVDPTCLQWLCDYYNNPPECTNPDSVYVDTCRTSPTYMHWFSKGTFSLTFDRKDILPLPPVPADSVVEVTWGSISVQYPSIRLRFSQLEQQFGLYRIRREYPEESTTHNLSQRFLLQFDQSVDVQAVVGFINGSADYTTLLYLDRDPIPVSVPPAPAISPDTLFTLSPNPVLNKLVVTFTKGLPFKPLVILNMNGDVVAAMSFDCVAPPCTIAIPVNQLSAGVYAMRYGHTTRLFTVIR